MKKGIWAIIGFSLTRPGIFIHRFKCAWAPVFLFALDGPLGQPDGFILRLLMALLGFVIMYFSLTQTLKPEREALEIMGHKSNES